MELQSPNQLQASRMQPLDLEVWCYRVMCCRHTCSGSIDLLLQVSCLLMSCSPARPVCPIHTRCVRVQTWLAYGLCNCQQAQ